MMWFTAFQVALIRILVASFSVGLLSFAAVGCGNSTSTSSSGLKCCLNGAYYECEDQEEFETCTLTGDDECDRALAKDDQCSD